MKTTFQFCYGALSDPIEKQANEQGYTLGDKATVMNRLADNLAMLYVHGIINDGEHTKAMKRLHKKITSCLKPLERS